MEYRHNTGQNGTIRKCHTWHASLHTRACDADLRHGDSADTLLNGRAI